MTLADTPWGPWGPAPLAEVVARFSASPSPWRRVIARLGLVSADGIPYLAPEVQLFYRAKGRRPKDERDFSAALPILSDQQRKWLATAIGRTFADHPWLERLRG